jgi:hypothetical protein
VMLFFCKRRTHSTFSMYDSPTRSN